MSNPVDPEAIEGVSGWTGWTPNLSKEQRDLIAEAQHDSNMIVKWGVPPAERLGDISVVLLILNRCIGTGVFNSASVITRDTQSLGLSIVFWMCASIIALAGTYLYVELGLTIPRFTWNGIESCTPQNGGELNYLAYIMEAPKHFSRCVFGITFIILANTAANSINFGHQAQIAGGRSDSQVTYTMTAGVGILATTFSCLLHALSRKYGIWLNNILGSAKFLTLLFLIIAGFATIGVLRGRGSADSDAAGMNSLDPASAFEKTGTHNGPFRFAEAFLFVLFPYGGFHQANNVLAEIDQPRKKFKRSTFSAIITVCVMFTLLNIAYTIVVPKPFQFEGKDIGQEFFKICMRTLAGTSEERAGRVFAGLKAVSSLGNVIVVTFTAARVKQEIAKEGILPSSLRFAQSYHISLRSLFSRSPSPTELSESTPVPALMLHWFFTTIVIIAAVIGVHNAVPKESGNEVSADAYYFVVSMYAFVLDVIIYAWIGLGMLYLRLSPARGWAAISTANHWLSILCALIFSAGTVFPLICLWIPDPQKPMLAVSSAIPWYVSQTVSFAIIGFAMLYWVGFRYVIPKAKKGGLEFINDRTPVLHEESDGTLVQLAELVTTYWGHRDPSAVDGILRQREMRMMRTPDPSFGDEQLREREAGMGRSLDPSFRDEQLRQR